MGCVYWNRLVDTILMGTQDIEFERKQLDLECQISVLSGASVINKINIRKNQQYCTLNHSPLKPKQHRDSDIGRTLACGETAGPQLAPHISRKPRDSVSAPRAAYCRNCPTGNSQL